jgi:hypothetical protein
VNDHDEDATAEQLPARERRRLQTSRLIQYLLLQALIAGACVLALLQSLPGLPPNIRSRRSISPRPGSSAR